MKTLRILLVVATALLTASFVSAQTWTLTSAPADTNWISIASSADGSKLVAVANGGIYNIVGIIYGTLPGPIYTSTNSGLTWCQTAAPSEVWQSVASSSDGIKLAAVAANVGIFTSTNSGETWAQATNAPTASLIASSSDGSELVAASPGALYVAGAIYISTNSGITWSQTSAPTDEDWYSVASSADGSKLLAAAFDGWVYFSTNSGGTWMQANIPNIGWMAAAVSSDGTTFVAAAYLDTMDNGGPIYVSTNSGVIWTQTSAPIVSWQAVASSADGTILLAATASAVYTSTNSGATWTSNSLPSEPWWLSVSLSADGNKLVAAAYNGGIYTAQITPAPRLNLALSDANFLLSWTVPSTNFVLQQSSDLGSWTDVSNAPVLNLTNLQDEVALSPTNSSGFYRLRTP